MTELTDLGCTTNVTVLNHFISVDGCFVIDAGCGSMTWTRHLAGLGAHVLAIDPDPVQANLNRESELVPNVEFVEAGADRIPVESDSVDGVFFSYSLHHIPAAVYPQVFDEVLRVLKPNGFVYVIEPIDCPINDVMKLFHNEDLERRAAWNALETFADVAFDSAQVVKYHSFSEYESFEQFAAHFTRQSFNSIYTEADVRNPVVREAFERLGGPNGRFKSEKRVMYLQQRKSDLS